MPFRRRKAFQHPAVKKGLAGAFGYCLGGQSCLEHVRAGHPVQATTRAWTWTLFSWIFSCCSLSLQCQQQNAGNNSAFSTVYHSLPDLQIGSFRDQILQVFTS